MSIFLLQTSKKDLPVLPPLQGWLFVWSTVPCLLRLWIWGLYSLVSSPFSCCLSSAVRFFALLNVSATKSIQWHMDDFQMSYFLYGMKHPPSSVLTPLAIYFISSVHPKLLTCLFHPFSPSLVASPCHEEEQWLQNAHLFKIIGCLLITHIIKTEHLTLRFLILNVHLPGPISDNIIPSLWSSYRNPFFFLPCYLLSQGLWTSHFLS